MKHTIHKRAVAVLLLLALLVGIVPAAVATDAQSSVEPSAEEPIASGSESVENTVSSPDGSTAEDDVPRSMDGETLTRDEDLLKSSESSSSGGLLRSLRVALAANSASTGTMSKSTCVDFAAYTSPTWYCNRYTTEGTHTWLWRMTTGDYKPGCTGCLARRGRKTSTSRSAPSTSTRAWRDSSKNLCGSIRTQGWSL